jgi:hypothetical protein
LKCVERGVGQPVAGGVVAFSPASTSVPGDLAVAAVGLLDGGVEDLLARRSQMSGPVPSPSMNGMMGCAA